MTRDTTTMRSALTALAALASLFASTAPGMAEGAVPGRMDAGAVLPVLDADLIRGLPTTLVSLHGRRQARQGLTKRAAVRDGYRPVSELTGGAYPTFSPGIGAVYVRRESLPSGPFIAFDRKGRQVSTIYKFSLDRMAAKEAVSAEGTSMPPVDHVRGYFSGSHPGVDFPHYSLVFWHVSPKDEGRVAK